LKISDLSLDELAKQLRRGDLLIDLGPLVARLKSNVPHLHRDIAAMYADFNVCTTDSFADFHVEIDCERQLQSGFKRQAIFYVDGRRFFVPLTLGQAFAGLEWGMNWCVTSSSHQYLIIHAAVIEKNGRAALLPAPPGSGKSTLCAGLVLRGWRLLSDELALYDMATGLVHGMARPINLKNKSIAVVRAFAPEARMTEPVPNTTKGTVALLAPPTESVLRHREPVRPSWIVLPRYVAGAEPNLEPHSRAQTFLLLAEQSFNYHIHGQRGFDAVGRLIDSTQCFQFSYSRLDDAQRVFDALAETPAV
jgi:HprK-related kinase A